MMFSYQMNANQSKAEMATSEQNVKSLHSIGHEAHDEFMKDNLQRSINCAVKYKNSNLLKVQDGLDKHTIIE